MLWLILIAYIIFKIILLTIEWSVHINMVKDYTMQYGYSSYKVFKREFDKQNWSNENHRKFGLWDKESNSQFHASIIKYNGIGMIIRDPISYAFARRYAYKYYKDNFAKYYKVEKYKWR